MRGLFFYSFFFFLSLAVAVVTAYSIFAGIVFFVGIGVIAWAIYSPKQAMMAAFFFIPFDKLTTLSLFGSGGEGLGPESFLSLPKIILIVCFFSWIMRTTISGDFSPIQRFRGSPLIWFVCCFIFISLASGIKSGSLRSYAFFEIRLIYLFLVYFLLIVNLVEDEVVLRKSLKIFLIGYSLVGLIGFLEICTKSHFLEMFGYSLEKDAFAAYEYRFRALATYGDPNYFGIAMVHASALTAVFAGTAKSKTARSLFIALMVLFFFCILGSASRASMIAYFATMGVILLFSKVRHKWAMGFGGLSLGVLFLAVYTFAFSTSTLNRYLTEKSSAGRRLGVLRVGLKVVHDNPILGVGTGNFPEVYNQYLTPVVQKTKSLPLNHFVQVWSENGTLGLLAYLAMYVAAAYTVYRAIRSGLDKTVQLIGIANIAFLLGFAIFISTQNIQGIEEIHWLSFAFCVAVWSNKKDRRFLAEKNV